MVWFLSRSVNTKLWTKIFTHIVILNVIIGLKSCVNGKKIWSDEDKYLDYGSTTKWVPRVLRSTKKHETKSTTINTSRSSLSPEQALEVAKMLVLPMNDPARLKAMQTYGTNKEGMERMMQDWMKESANSSFLRPMKVALRVDDKDLGDPVPWSHKSLYSMEISKQLASNFWNTSHPEAINFNLLRQQKQAQDKIPRLDLPGASFWEENNAAAQPGVPYATTFKYNIQKATREHGGGDREDLQGLPEDPHDLIEDHTPLTTRTATATESAGHAVVHKIIDKPHKDLQMYDYSSPSWDEMPTLLMIKSTTQVTYSFPESTTTLFPEANSTHPAVARAKQLMWNHQMKHLSAFISTFCEIISLHKKGRNSRRLAIGLMVSIEALMSSGRLADLGTDTIKRIEDQAGLLSEYKEEELEMLLDTIHYVFQNHSYFANDSRQVLEEIESWYSLTEGEHLLETLMMVEDFPNGGLNQKQIMDKVLHALLVPYFRLAGTDKRASTLFKLDLVMARIRRRQFGTDNENVLTTIKYENKSSNDVRMKEHKEKLKGNREKTIKDPAGKYSNTNLKEKVNFEKYKINQDIDDELERAKRIVQMDRENFNSIGRPIKVIERHDIDRRYKFDDNDDFQYTHQMTEENTEVYKPTSNLLFDIKNRINRITTQKKHSTSVMTKLNRHKNKSTKKNAKVHKTKSTIDYKNYKKYSNESPERKLIRKYSNKSPDRKLIRQGLHKDRESNDEKTEKFRLKKIVAKYADEMQNKNENFSIESVENRKYLMNEKAREKKLREKKEQRLKHNKTYSNSSLESDQEANVESFKDISEGVTKFEQHTVTAIVKPSSHKKKKHKNANNTRGSRKKTENGKEKHKESKLRYGTKQTRHTRVYFPKRYTVKTRSDNYDWEKKYTQKSTNAKKKKVTTRTGIKSQYIAHVSHEVKSKYVLHSNNEDDTELKYVAIPKGAKHYLKNKKNTIQDINLKSERENKSIDEEETKQVSYEKVEESMKTVTYNKLEIEDKKLNTTLPEEEISKDISESSETKKSKYVNALLNSNENLTAEKRIRNRFKENFIDTTISRPGSYNVDKIRNISEENNETRVNNALRKVIEESSYSDDENDIKSNLNDALRHGALGNITNVGRRNILIKKKKTIRDASTETDDEGVLKNNIYKVFGSGHTINKYHDD